MDSQNKDKVPVPAGYREGLVGAITVVLGFSLLFMRYWSLEAPGDWDALSFIAEVLLVVAIFLVGRCAGLLPPSPS
jgi:hypothetical protein